MCINVCVCVFHTIELSFALLSRMGKQGNVVKMNEWSTFSPSPPPPPIPMWACACVTIFVSSQFNKNQIKSKEKNRKICTCYHTLKWHIYNFKCVKHWTCLIKFNLNKTWNRAKPVKTVNVVLSRHKQTKCIFLL